MKFRRMNLTDVLTTSAIVLALGSAALSVKMALADELTVGTFKEGQDLGERNGGLVAQRVYNKVILKKGCAGLNQYQNALNAVTRGIRGPRGQSSQFTAGFYQGYLNAVRQSLKGARAECNQSRYNEGSYPGAFFAEIFCQIADQDASALADVSFGPIYDGWSASQEVRDECSAVFNVVASECASTGIAAQLLDQVQRASCNE